jgi:hypothetical protein
MRNEFLGIRIDFLGWAFFFFWSKVVGGSGRRTAVAFVRGWNRQLQGWWLIFVSEN